MLVPVQLASLNAKRDRLEYRVASGAARDQSGVADGALQLFFYIHHLLVRKSVVVVVVDWCKEKSRGGSRVDGWRFTLLHRKDGVVRVK